MGRIFDSLNICLATQLAESNPAELGPPDIAIPILEALRSLSFRPVAEKPSKTALVDDSETIKPLGHIASLCSCLARRQYHEAQLHLNAFSSSPDSNWLYIPQFDLANMILCLYWEREWNFKFGTELQNALEELTPIHRIDFLTTTVIALTMTKLQKLNGHDRWSKTAEDLLIHIRKLVDLHASDDRLRQSRTLQAKACLFQAQKNYSESCNLFSEAASVYADEPEKLSGYQTELTIDMTYANLSFGKYDEVIVGSYAAIECELAQTKDSLRLGKAFSVCAEGLLGEGEIRSAYDAMKKANFFFESASSHPSYHYGDRILLLHRLHALATRLQEKSEVLHFRHQIQDLNESHKHRFP
jgi:hypothetical protein